MTSERLDVMFKGDSADTYARKFPLVLMGGRANPSSVRRWEALSDFDILSILSYSVNSIGMVSSGE